MGRYKIDAKSMCLVFITIFLTFLTFQAYAGSAKWVKWNIENKTSDSSYALSYLSQSCQNSNQPPFTLAPGQSKGVCVEFKQCSSSGHPSNYDDSYLQFKVSKANKEIGWVKITRQRGGSSILIERSGVPESELAMDKDLSASGC